MRALIASFSVLFIAIVEAPEKRLVGLGPEKQPVSSIQAPHLSAIPFGSPFAITVVDSFERLVWPFGPISGDSATDLVVDDDGSVFISGTTGGLDIDHDGVIDYPTDGNDGFYMKLDSNGEVVWLRTPSSQAVYERAGYIALDRAGGLYGLGGFNEPLRFGDEATLRPRGSKDGYLVRYGSEGELKWVRTIGGDGSASFQDVASDPVGNAFVTGLVTEGHVSLDGHERRFRAADGYTKLLVSYDREGAVRWVRSWSGGDWRFRNVKVGPKGDVWVGGHHGKDGLDFDNDGEQEIEGGMGMNGFIARFTSTGEFLRSWNMRSLEDGDQSGGAASEIIFASNGDVVLGGSLTAPLDFDGDGAADAVSHDDVPMSGFVARYTPDGELRWVRIHQIGAAWDLATDGRRFVLAGSYEGMRDLNQDGSIDERDRLGDPAEGKEEILALVLSEEGRYEHHITAPGVGDDRALSVEFARGRPAIWLSGYFKLTADFSGNRVDDEGYAVCHAAGDIFLVRYGLLDEPRRIVLSTEPWANGSRRGTRLVWTGATSEVIDVYRDGELLTTTPNDGVYDEPPVLDDGTFEYRVCEAGSSLCSNTVSITS